MAMQPVLLLSIKIAHVEICDDVVTDIQPFDGRSDFNYLACCVGAGDHVFFDGEGISSVCDHDVAVVERDAVDFHQYLIFIYDRLRLRKLLQIPT